MGRRWWNKQRRICYLSNDYTCMACGDSEAQPLEAHEMYELDFEHRISKFVGIVPLCHKCHMFIHWTTVPSYERSHYLKHGIGVLLGAGLKVPLERSSRVEWQLGIDEVFYELPGHTWTQLFVSEWKLDLSSMQPWEIRRAHKNAGKDEWRIIP